MALIATIEFCFRNGLPVGPTSGDEDGQADRRPPLELAAAPISATVIGELAGVDRRRNFGWDVEIRPLAPLTFT